MLRRKAVRRPPRKPIRTQAARPPRPPIRRNPILPPGIERMMIPRPGPSPEMVGEDYVVPEMPEFQPHLPPRQPRSDMANIPPRQPVAPSPRWEGVMPPGGVEGGNQFDLSEDVMNALMEMLMRGRSPLGGRAY